MPPLITEVWRREAVSRGFTGNQLVSCAVTAPVLMPRRFWSNQGTQSSFVNGFSAVLSNAAMIESVVCCYARVPSKSNLDDTPPEAFL